MNPHFLALPSRLLPPPLLVVTSSLSPPSSKDLSTLSSAISAPVTPAPPPSPQLRAEIEAAAPALAGTGEDWEERCAKMARLEAMVVGSGAQDGLAEAIKSLKRPLETQLLDRRSSVCKQACQLVAVLSGALGGAFEGMGLHVVPVLFKVVVLTVQVMADSAFDAVSAVLWNCHR